VIDMAGRNLASPVTEAYWRGMPMQARARRRCRRTISMPACGRAWTPRRVASLFRAW